MDTNHSTSPPTPSPKGSDSYALILPPSLADQVNFVIANLGHVGNVANQFFLQHTGSLEEDGMKMRAVKVMSFIADAITELESLSEAMLEKASQSIPITVVECVAPEAPLPEPVTLQLGSGDSGLIELRESVPQRRLTTTIPQRISQPYLFEIKHTDATGTIDLPYTVQFTPTASASGSAPVDNALCVDVNSANEYPHRLIKPSQYLSTTGPSFSKAQSTTSEKPTSESYTPTCAPSLSTPPEPPTSNSVVGSTSVPIPAEENATAVPREGGIEETPGVDDRPYEELSSAKKSSKHQCNTQAPEPSSASHPEPTDKSGLQMTGSRPFHHHDMWPRPPSSKPRALTRRGAFYHKSHPKLWWEDKWGEKPSDKAIVTVEDCLPPWAGGYPEPESGSGSGSETATTTKGQDKTVDSEMHGDQDVSPAESPQEVTGDDDVPSRGHPRPPKPHAASHWNGFTNTIRSLAASVKGIGKDGGSNEASTSSSSGGIATDPSSSSRSGLRSQSKKRRREYDESYDSNDDSVFWSAKKRAKRPAKK